MGDLIATREEGCETSFMQCRPVNKLNSASQKEFVEERRAQVSDGEYVQIGNHATDPVLQVRARNGLSSVTQWPEELRKVCLVRFRFLRSLGTYHHVDIIDWLKSPRLCVRAMATGQHGSLIRARIRRVRSQICDLTDSISAILQKPRPTRGVWGLLTAPCVATRFTTEVAGLFTATPSSAT